MSESFHFNRFSVAHDRCAMKVGTDGILLGSWANVENKSYALDIGTGSGLIALMLAQRAESSAMLVDAIEIDENSAHQAAINVENSPWSNRISVTHASVQAYANDFYERRPGYDLLICNPPYFRNGSMPDEPSKRFARHHTRLSFHDLFHSVTELMSKYGSFCVVIPFDQLEGIRTLALHFELYPRLQTFVQPLPGKPFHRALIEFQFEFGSCKTEELLIEHRHHFYTLEFQSLTEQYYLPSTFGLPNSHVTAAAGFESARRPSGVANIA